MNTIATLVEEVRSLIAESDQAKADFETVRVRVGELSVIVNRDAKRDEDALSPLPVFHSRERSELFRACAPCGGPLSSSESELHGAKMQDEQPGGNSQDVDDDADGKGENWVRGR